MNTKEMMGALDALANCKKTEADIRRDNTIQRMMECDNIVRGKLPALREIVPVVARLFKDKLVEFGGIGRDKCDWITDGWYHNLGFFQEDHMVNFNHFGENGGGAWYDSVCVDINTGLWLRHGDSVYSASQWTEPMPMKDFIVAASSPYYENYRPKPRANCDNSEVTGKIQNIANGIDHFIEKVGAFVNVITKRARSA